MNLVVICHSTIQQQQQQQGSTNITSIDDVPEEIDSLTVADVGKCLQLLNMDSHVEYFRRQQVDGKLLTDLSETLLLGDFRLTPFNASKLLRFVRGWRPKLA